MSRDGSVDFVWAGDNQTFRLGIGELLRLQEKLNSGPAEIAQRLRAGTWRVQDLQEVFRIALIGAGVDPKKAQELIEANIVPGKLASHVIMAWAIIVNALQGDEADPVGKDEATTEAPGQTASPPPPSMDQAWSWASVLSRWTQ